jgi:GNAT superfamily N-acetyltransferase
MDIRECREDDFDMVLPLLRQLWPDKLLEMEALRRVFARALQEKDVRYICAEIDGVIVGFFSLTQRESLYRQGRLAYLDEMVVEEGHRSKGVGAALLRHAEQLAREAGCNGLSMDSAFHREGAHRFYEREGYVKTGVIFEKALLP